MSFLDKIDSKVIGNRLKRAREEAMITQEDAAKIIEVARSTLVAIEKGQRKVKAKELDRLATLFDVSCQSLLQPETIRAKLIPQFRKSFSIHMNGRSAIETARLLQKLSISYLELETILNVRKPVNHLEEYIVSSGSMSRQAEDLATRVRFEMGFGTQPIQDLKNQLEIRGFRIFERDLNSKISGLFAYDDELGPCILINRVHPHDRKLLSLVHEFGHYLVSRDMPDVYWTTTKMKSQKTEKFVNMFSYAFLMPSSAIRQSHGEIYKLEKKFSSRSVIYLSGIFNVSVEAMARRLEELQLIKEGSHRLIRDNIPVSEFKPVQIEESISNLVPPRLGYLISVAHSENLLSEGQIADKFCLDRIQVREILNSYGDE